MINHYHYVMSVLPNNVFGFRSDMRNIFYDSIISYADDAESERTKKLADLASQIQIIVFKTFFIHRTEIMSGDWEYF